MTSAARPRRSTVALARSSRSAVSPSRAPKRVDDARDPARARQEQRDRAHHRDHLERDHRGPQREATVGDALSDEQHHEIGRHRDRHARLHRQQQSERRRHAQARSRGRDPSPPASSPRRLGASPRCLLTPLVRTRRRGLDGTSRTGGDRRVPFLPFVGVAQWLEHQPSKLVMRVRFPSPALARTAWSRGVNGAATTASTAAASGRSCPPRALTGEPIPARASQSDGTRRRSPQGRQSDRTHAAAARCEAK